MNLLSISVIISLYSKSLINDLFVWYNGNIPLQIVDNKGVNTVPEAVSVWLAVRYISDTGVPFQVYRYYIIFIYIYIYIDILIIYLELFINLYKNP